MANIQQQIIAPSAPDTLATISTPQVPQAQDLLQNQQLAEIKALLDSVNTTSLFDAVTNELDYATNGTVSAANWLVSNDAKAEQAKDYTQQAQENSNRNDRYDGRTAEYTRSDSSSAEMPDMMKSITGVDTWGEMARNTGQAMVTGLASMQNPVLGKIVSAGFNLANESDTDEEGKTTFKAANVINAIEDTVLGISGLGMVTNIAEAAAELAGVYNREDGIVNSLIDVINGDETIDTVAGFYAAGGAEAQQSRIREAIAAQGGDVNAGSDYTNNGMGSSAYDRISFGGNDSGSDRSGSDNNRGTGASDGGLGSGSFGGSSLSGNDNAGTDASNGGMGSGSFGGADFGGSSTGETGSKDSSGSGNNSNDKERSDSSDGTGSAKDSVGANW